MTLPIHLNPAAELDYINAIRWYEDQRAGTGKSFCDRVRRSFDSIQTFPNGGSPILGKFRACRVRRYPYRIIYSVESDSIQVWAVFHTSRDPKALDQRLPYE